MNRRTFLKKVIIVATMRGIPAVKLPLERMFVAKSFIDRTWSKTIFEHTLKEVFLPTIMIDAL